MSDGDRPAKTASGLPRPDALFVEYYAELRRLAASKLRSESSLTLEPTALVHEVYLRLEPGRRHSWQNRSQFMAVAAHMMRNVVIDQARRVRAGRRGAGWKQVDLHSQIAIRTETPEDLLWLDEILNRLAAIDKRQATILECRLFSGMTVPEVAEALGVSRRTVEAEWTVIRAWVRQQISARAKASTAGM